MRSAAFLCVLLAVAAAGCGGGGSDGDGAATTTTARVPVERSVSSADLGRAWPLAVSGGTLRCEGPGAVSFMTDEGIVYAVNVTATEWSRTNNLSWSEVGEIQAEDPATGGKMKLAPLIALGLRLCDASAAGQDAGTASG